MSASTKTKTLPKDSALYLPPDGYSRFFVIISLLEHLYGKTNKPITILDVGGCSPFLKELLDRTNISYQLTILDILPKPPEITVDYIQADATKSDLPDSSFDVVVSTDTLEHIPKDIKDDFVLACVRLTKGVCILAAPFDTDGVNDGEQLVNDFNKHLFRVGQDWLEEHFEHGKPKLDKTQAVLDKAGIPYEHFGTNNLFSWIFSTHMNLLEAKIGIGQKQGRKANLNYNQLLAESMEFTQPTYRHFFVIYKDKRFVTKNILQNITKSPNPKTLGAYMHTMFTLAADRMTELNQNADTAQEKVRQLEQQIHNEKVHSQKLNEQLIQVNDELRQLAPFRKIAKLRHPRQVARSIKKRVAK